nr:MAG TPA: hypothetical protein [Caudoviricetes sp.]
MQGKASKPPTRRTTSCTRTSEVSTTSKPPTRRTTSESESV